MLSMLSSRHSHIFFSKIDYEASIDSSHLVVHIRITLSTVMSTSNELCAKILNRLLTQAVAATLCSCKYLTEPFLGYKSNCL